MSRGIIYVMTTAVNGLIKIGKTGMDNYTSRMYNLEHDGYRNVTALKRAFAISVEDYDEKEIMLHTIFEKSRVGNTELFALDINIVVQLLSSFDGEIIYPKTESKEDAFNNSTDNINGKLIPDGTYTFRRKKMSDDRIIMATAIIKNGVWTLLKGSILGTTEDVGCSNRAKIIRASMPIDEFGKLLEDFEIGECSPSFAGAIVMYQSNNGWADWRNSTGESIDVYRKRGM